MSFVASIVPMGPVLSAAMACAASSMLGVALPAEAKFCSTKDVSPVLSRYTAQGTEKVHSPSTYCPCAPTTARASVSSACASPNAPCVKRFVRIPTTSWLNSLS